MFAMRSVAFALPCIIAFAAAMTSFNTLAHAEDEAPVAKRKVLKAADGSSDEEEAPQVATPARDGNTNLSISPLGLLIGYLNADLEFKVSPQWSVGPTASYWSLKMTSSYYQDGITAQSWALGVRGNWSKNGTYKRGLYISPMFQYVTSKATGTSISSGTNITAEVNIPVASGLIGYQWFGQTLNMRIGIGPALALAGSSKVKVTDGAQTVEVETTRTAGIAIDFMIGYVF